MSTQVAQPQQAPEERLAQRRWGLLLVPLTVLVLVVAVAAYRFWPVHVPFAASDLHLRLVSLQSVPTDQAQAKVDALAGPGRLHVPLEGDHVLVGQIAYDVPAGATADAQWSFFLIDADGQPVRQIFGTTPSVSTSSGWDGDYDAVAHQVPQLARIAAAQDSSGGWTSSGMALALPTTTPGPLTFVAVPNADAVGADDASTYSVWSALQSGTTVFWAVRVPR